MRQTSERKKEDKLLVDLMLPWLAGLERMVHGCLFCLWILVPVCLPPSLRKLREQLSEALPGLQDIELREEACPVVLGLKVCIINKSCRVLRLFKNLGWRKLSRETKSHDGRWAENFQGPDWNLGGNTV